MTSLFLVTNFSYAYNDTAIETESLNSLAKEIMALTKTQDALLKEVEELIPTKVVKKHQHKKHQPIQVSPVTPLVIEKVNKKMKMKKLLSALGGLAKKEGTDSACTFCSAILKDVMVNKVEIVDMAQDWVQLKIKKGHTLSHFAKSYYGDANAYKAIYALNKKTMGKNYTMYAGNVLTLPRLETLEKQNTKKALSCKFCAALLSDSSLKNIDVLNIEKDYTEVKIRKGDSLSKLAYKYYGKASHYGKIFDANRDKIGTNYLIHVGDILRIPNPA